MIEQGLINPLSFAMGATNEQKAMCKSVGTGQCAPICLETLCYRQSIECPHAEKVWTPTAIKREKERRAGKDLILKNSGT